MTDPQRDLATYLNDHLAGARGGIELAESYLSSCDDRSPGREVITQIRRDLEDDQQALEQVMVVLGVERSLARQGLGWLAEKVTQIKIHEGSSQALHLLMMVEALSSGSMGRLGLLDRLASLEAPDQGLPWKQRAARALDHLTLLRRLGTELSARAF